MRCLLLHRIFFCYEVIVKQKIYKRSTNHNSDASTEIQFVIGTAVINTYTRQTCVSVEDDLRLGGCGAPRYQRRGGRCWGKAACFNTTQLCQVHQFFVCCSVEPRLRMESINDKWALNETCREAFVCAKAAPLATQQVSETLRQMLSVEDEGRRPKSGYSIDMPDRPGDGRREEQKHVHVGGGV